MDALGTILTAVVTGAATALKPTAEQAVKEAYAGLKGLIQGKYGERKKVGWGLESVEEDPESEGGRKLLEEGLSAAEAGQDEALVEAAEALLEALKETDAGKEALGKYQIDARGAQIGIIGDRGKVEGGLHFGKDKE